MADDSPAESQHSASQHEQEEQRQPHIYRPIPLRNFSTATRSSDSPETLSQRTPPILNTDNRSSEFLAQLNARLLRTNNYRYGNAPESTSESSLPKNKSFLNMTSSTLYGIYDDVGTSTAGDRSVAETPWGTGAETPARHSIDSGHGGVNGWENGLGSPDGGLRMKGLARRGTTDRSHSQRTRSRHLHRPRKQGLWKYAAVAGKLFALFSFGVIYGIIVSHLHDTRELAAVQVGGVDRESWIYFTGWGLAGSILGSLLPWVDLVWDDAKDDDSVQKAEGDDESDSTLTEQLNEVVRSVGAFVGIAFAIRRLPWQSTLQLTLTLTLVNPALWYILDRSKPGLSFSLITTSILTSFIFLSNPDILPSPALPATTNGTYAPSQHSPSRGASPVPGYQDELFAGIVSYDNLATVTWVGSVIFCSCVCFGGIGRRLAVTDEWRWKK